MNYEHLLYLKEKNTAWFNPCYGLMFFWDECRKLQNKFNKSFQEIWSHRDLKRAKEIYAISIIAKATENQEKNGTWWIMKPKNDPPDGVMGTIIKKNGIEKIHVREIEVVEHISGNVLNTIRKKLSSKHYEPNTILVCYISKGGSYDFEKIAKEISYEITNLNHIFFVFPGLMIKDIPMNATEEKMIRTFMQLSVVQVKPVYSITTIDPISVCESWRAGKESNFFIYEGLGKGGTRPIKLENPPKLF